MYTVLATLLSKTIDILLKKADLSRDSNGPVRFYELYLSLQRMIENAGEIEGRLQKYRSDSNRSYQLDRLSDEVEKQAKELNAFCGILWSLSFYVHIYDGDLHEDLTRILGIKYQALRFYTDIFIKIEGDSILVGSERAAANLSAAREFMVRLRAPVDQNDSSNERRLFDLATEDDINALIKLVRKNIETLQIVADKLSHFIKENCQLKDLFPKYKLVSRNSR